MSNQTRKRREGDVGGWVLAARLKKGGTFPPSPQRGNRPFPHMGRPTDKASSAFRLPRGGGFSMEVGTTPSPDQVGGWVSDQPQKCLVYLGRDTRTSTQSRRLVRRKDASWSLNWPSGANLLARKQHMYFFGASVTTVCLFFFVIGRVLTRLDSI